MDVTMKKYQSETIKLIKAGFIAKSEENLVSAYPEKSF
jgi:hypothetical protein